MICVDSLSRHENEKHTEKNKSTKMKPRNYIADNGELFIQHAGFLVL